MNVTDLIRETAARYGQDPGPWLKTVQIESSGNPNARTGNARGLFQFMPATWARYGNGRDPFDPVANTDAAFRLARDNATGFHHAFGRTPTAGETYLMHQQGLGGATKLLQNPDARAVDILGHQAVVGNGGHAGMTSREFANRWTSRFDGASGADASPMAAPQPPAPTALEQQPSPLVNALTAAADTFSRKPPAARPQTQRLASGLTLVDASPVS